ncbi:MAG: hypothetical protein KGZ89_05335 [Actinobacteria bacterium]|nr:hypothetical protein [Actinomycetota bacterium]
MLDSTLLQILVGLVALTVLLSLAYLGWAMTYRWIVRSALLSLVGYYEQVSAARHSFLSVIRHLIADSDDALIFFATNAESDDRKALMEIAERMLITRDELDIRRLPFKLEAAAVEIADTAHLLASTAGSLSDGGQAGEILDRIGGINLKEVDSQHKLAGRVLDELCIEYKIRDTAVYGGGLYI